MTPAYPKRLIEVDLPIKRISAHARREKSIRHGHISTLHIWSVTPPTRYRNPPASGGLAAQCNRSAQWQASLPVLARVSLER